MTEEIMQGKIVKASIAYGGYAPSATFHIVLDDMQDTPEMPDIRELARILGETLSKDTGQSA
jgi:hypothetical protein